ncbi:MAG: TfoX/Sxy family protein [Candidatus Shapirobacteria bacterium]|jgi:TfoX/Sxy family transcriptional regulator of competence genes
MKTKQSTIDFILDQLASAGNVHARKMFGEYALYYGNKVVGLVCRDTLFIKITDQGEKYVGEHYQEGHAYKGATTSMVICEDLIEDREWLSKLVRITADQLPAPKLKKSK